MAWGARRVWGREPQKIRPLHHRQPEPQELDIAARLAALPTILCSKSQFSVASISPIHLLSPGHCPAFNTRCFYQRDTLHQFMSDPVGPPAPQLPRGHPLATRPKISPLVITSFSAGLKLPLSAASCSFPKARAHTSPWPTPRNHSDEALAITSNMALRGVNLTRLKQHLGRYRGGATLLVPYGNSAGSA